MLASLVSVQIFSASCHVGLRVALPQGNAQRAGAGFELRVASPQRKKERALDLTGALLRPKGTRIGRELRVVVREWNAQRCKRACGLDSRVASPQGNALGT